MNNKLLILDGISGISLGEETAEAFHNLEIPTEYIASAHLSRKIFSNQQQLLKKYWGILFAGVTTISCDSDDFFYNATSHC